MIAFDTNLLVRLLVDDAPDQADVAEALLAANTVFISRTVLLETEWVLRAGYRKTREQISGFFCGTAGNRQHRDLAPRHRGPGARLVPLGR